MTELNMPLFMHLTYKIFFMAKSHQIRDMISELYLGVLSLMLLHLHILGIPYFYLLPDYLQTKQPRETNSLSCACPTKLISDFLDNVFQPHVGLLS